MGFLSLISRVKTIRHTIKAVKSGERGRPRKVCHGTSLKENEHEQS
jgi:hypothetical protein